MSLLILGGEEKVVAVYNSLIVKSFPLCGSTVASTVFAELGSTMHLTSKCKWTDFLLIEHDQSILLT